MASFVPSLPHSHLRSAATRRRHGPSRPRISAAWARPPRVCSTAARARAARWPPPGTAPRGRSPPAQGRYSRGRPCRHPRRWLLRDRRPATRHAAPSVARQQPLSSCAARNCAPEAPWRRTWSSRGHPLLTLSSPIRNPCTEGHTADHVVPVQMVKDRFQVLLAGSGGLAMHITVIEVHT